jgi:hypothetical protein
MVPVDGDGWDAPLLEGVLWGVLAAVAVVRARRAAAAARPGWWLIVGGLGAIVLDKAVDVHAVAHAAGAWLATVVDPEHHLRGPNAGYRHVALATGFAVAAAGVAWWIRRHAQVGRAKLLCLAGLGVVGALVTARLAPGLEALLPDLVSKAIELAAWLLVAAGLRCPEHRPPSAGRLVDGFL